MKHREWSAQRGEWRMERGARSAENGTRMHAATSLLPFSFLRAARSFLLSPFSLLRAPRSACVAVFVIACLLTSCWDYFAKESSVRFEFLEQTWNHFKPFASDFEITTVQKAYDISLAFEVTDDFEHTHLSFLFVLTAPDGQENILQQSVRLKDENGRFLGYNNGNLWTIVHPLYIAKEFQETGKYEFCVKSTMQQYDLYRMNSIGISITPVKKRK